jgi:hypothetical protein
LARSLSRVATRNSGRAIIVCTTHVGLVAYQAPDCGYSPDGLPAWRRNVVLVELPGDLPHRQIIFDIVPKDASHDRPLGLVNFEVRGPVGAACDTPVTIRAFPGDHLASTRPPQLAAPISLSDLGTLILGNHALHLSKQLRLRVIGKWRRVVKKHRDAMACQLVEHNDLIGVNAGQPIRG